MALSPVVTCAGLSKDEVVRSEELSEGSGSDGVHGSGLEVHQNGTGDVPAASGLVVVDVDPLELEVRVSVVSTSRVNSVLVRDDLPEFGTDLVSALSSLDVNDLPHKVLTTLRII